MGEKKGTFGFWLYW